ncbi:hypothetical protein [uncultured Mitsuokella sp.]|uniref:hypothetical protein n=1 Tax=uncultured Mitsuokella sp. TaxID=453120 RepID=UPI0025CCEC87|nr:hypothetical protein [uncultured Mitsuokella sp.]
MGSLDYVHRGWEVSPGVAFTYHYTSADSLTTQLDVAFRVRMTRLTFTAGSS